MAKLIVGIDGLLIFMLSFALQLISMDDINAATSISYDTFVIGLLLSWGFVAMGIDDLRKSKKKK